MNDSNEFGSLSGHGGSPLRIVVTTNDTQPVQGLQSSKSFDAHSFHLKWNPPKEKESREKRGEKREELYEQVDSFLEVPIGGKPRIISTDGAGTLWKELTRTILQKIPKDGSVAYEHFDQRTSHSMLSAYVGPQYNWTDGLKRRANLLGKSASKLENGGVLSVGDGKWRWNGRPIFLAGMSVSYGVLGTTRHNIEAILNFLKTRGVNLLRVWVTEQWTSLVSKDDRGHPGSQTAIAPWPWQTQKYHLHERNQQWLVRLEKLLRMAAERGIVVQVSLFDWCGLRNCDGKGYWKQSPYNAKNNNTQYLNSNVPRNQWDQDFTKTEGPFWEHVIQPLIRDVAQVVARWPNAFIEIANEARAKSVPKPLEWHSEVAQVIRESSAR